MEKDPFKEYMKESEPDKAGKSYVWSTAIGLQAVDGLKTSEYLLHTADIFADHAWYFRNALVRANYTNLQKGVHETTEYLELFLRNLLLCEKNELHNRDMHISGLLSASKVDIRGEKVDIQGEKVDIQTPKVDIHTMLAEKKFSGKIISHIEKLV